MSPASGVVGPIREVLSPYKIAVLLFIEKYSRIGLKYGDSFPKGEEELEITPKERKATAHLLFRLVQGGDLTFKQLNQLVDSTSLSRKHVLSWQQALQQVLTDGLEGLQSLFDAVNRAVQQDNHETYPCIWISIVGLYLRQMNLLYKRLSIIEVVTLLSHFVNYCQSRTQGTSLSVLDQKPSTGLYSSLPPALDITMTSPPSSPSLLASPTPPQLSADMDVTAESPDPLLAHPDESVPGEALEDSTTPAFDSPESGEAYKGGACTWSVQRAEQLIGEQTQLLEFNEAAAMRADQLHHTLQQILVAHPHLSAAHYLSSLNYLRLSEVRGAVESLAAAYDSQQVTRSTPRTLRYAALNMAALYSHFGSKSVALRCVSEAISQSQEASDNTCLQHSLAWLYALAPHDKREGLIQSAVQRSSALKLPYLNWLSLINQAAHSTGRPPAHHLQMLVSRVDGCVGVGGGGVGGGGGVWGVEAGVWSGWLGGCSTMAVVCSQLVLHAPPTLQQQPSVSFATSQTAAVLCNIASALAGTGKYGMCHALLRHCRTLFPTSSPHSHFIRMTHAHVTCTYHMLGGRYTQARQALTIVSADQQVYVKIRSCEVSVYQGENESALQQVLELLRLQQVLDSPSLQVQVKLLYASALCGAGNCSAALQSLVATVALAQENHLALLHSLAVLQLIAVQLQLGLLSSSRTSRRGYESVDNPNIHTYNYYNISRDVNVAALDRALSVVMSSGGLYDQARSLLLLAKLRIRANSGMTEKLGRVAKDLERVKDMFAKMNARHRVRDTLYLTARVYHEAGLTEARNKASLDFRKLEQMLPCKNIVPPTPIF